MVLRSCILFLVALAAGGPAAAQNGPRPVFQKTFEANDVDYLYFVARGNVRVGVGPPGKITVTGRPRVRDGARKNSAAREAELRAILQDPPLQLYASPRRTMLYLGRFRKGQKAPRDWWYDFEVEAPPDTVRIFLDQDGDHRIEDLPRLQYVFVRRGRLELRNVSAGLRADTEEALAIRSRDADVELRQADIGKIHIRSGRGTVRIAARPADYWRVETERGDIHFDVPPEAAFHLSALTRRGRVESRIPLRPSGPQGSSRVNGKIRGGHLRVELRTVSGQILVQDEPGSAEVQHSGQRGASIKPRR